MTGIQGADRLGSVYRSLDGDRRRGARPAVHWPGRAGRGGDAPVRTGRPHLYISALLTLGLKALLIPWMLHRLAIRLNIVHEVDKIANPSIMLVAGAFLVIFSYYVATPIVHLSTLVTRNTIAVSMAVILLGMLLMVSRSKAVAQVVGFMSIENGLFFAAVASTYGMPMIVELGIAFDVLVAMVLFGVFFFQIRTSIDSLDVDRLNRLSERGE